MKNENILISEGVSQSLKQKFTHTVLSIKFIQPALPHRTGPYRIRYRHYRYRMLKNKALQGP